MPWPHDIPREGLSPQAVETLNLFRLIHAAMARHRGNKTRVAEELGLTRVGLRMKLVRLGLG